MTLASFLSSPRIQAAKGLNPYVLDYLGAAVTETYFVIIAEYCELGTLAAWLKGIVETNRVWERYGEYWRLQSERIMPVLLEGYLQLCKLHKKSRLACLKGCPV